MGPAVPGTPQRVIGGQECQGFCPQGVQFPVSAGVMVVVLVCPMCAGRRVDTLVVCYVLGDRASTHPRGVASAVFPNLYSTYWWKRI